MNQKIKIVLRLIWCVAWVFASVVSIIHLVNNEVSFMNVVFVVVCVSGVVEALLHFKKKKVEV